MSAVQLSEVQYLNMHALSVLATLIASDPAAACATFGLQRDELQKLEAALTPERILAISTASRESLVYFRRDAGDVLSSPVPLLGALFLARPIGMAPVAARPRS